LAEQVGCFASVIDGSVLSGLFSKIDEPARLPLTICPPSNRWRGAHTALTTDVLARRLVQGPLVFWLAGLCLPDDSHDETEVIEEIAVTTTSKDPQQRSVAAAVKAERALDKVAAMQEYEAEEQALRANTERLRALRLAREAENMQDASAQQAAKKKAAQDATVREQTKKAVKRVSAPKRTSGKPPKLS
jgi:hypothetical protein